MMEEANQVLNNKAFKEAFKKMSDYLEMKALSCNVDVPAETQRVVLAKQILKGIERELTRMVQDGQLAQMRLDELEIKRKVKMVR